MRRPILLNWQANNSFGWGLLGLNVLQQWASDPDVQPLMGFPIGWDDIKGIEPLRLMAMEQAANESNKFVEELNKGTVDLRAREVVLVNSVGNGLVTRRIMPRAVRSVARCIFEDARVDEADVKLVGYDSVLCASEWASGLLRAHTTLPVTMIHEGVDHTQFFPGPRSGSLDEGRFYVFSGGKIEFRKAHDLVLLAFREFAARHDDAVLVGAWQSPWPQISVGFKGRLSVPLQQNKSGQLELRRWVVENGISSKQFLELPRLPNPAMPSVLRDMDCAVQVSRCEACTNLPAKEAMACGVPLILADNTGVHDLIDGDNCLAVRSQREVVEEPRGATAGWGESSVEEIVAALEKLYTDTELRRRIGATGARWIVDHKRTWRDHARALKAHLLSLV